MEKVLDNRKNRIFDTLKKGLQNKAKVSVISAYFTIFAFDKLRKELESVDNFRFIFTSPTFVKENEDHREFYIERLSREKALAGSEFEIRLRNELTQSGIARECANWIRSKASFRSLKRRDSADGRMIHIANSGVADLLIQGSVDFSSSGLGLTSANCLSMSLASDDATATKEALQWFDSIWSNESLTEDVKDKVLTGIENIYKENSPEFIYFVTLYNVFRQYLDELTEDNVIKQKTGIKDTVVWNKLYRFQRDGVMGAIDKLEKHNGCIIADSVGLGKTFEALAVIKYYELRNHRVLVLAPKKLRDNWVTYRQNDRRNILASDRFSYDVLNHTDLSRKRGRSGDINLETVNWGNYDLVVIDESHNFRNNDPRKDHVTRYSRLMQEIIKSGVKTKVLMLSATPVNNRMNDLKNQVSFITEGNDGALAEHGVPSISDTLRTAQSVFNEWLKQPTAERTLESLLGNLDIDYFHLLDLMTIARSRKHVEKYYDLSEVGKFPERLKPINLKTEIDTHGDFPSYESVNATIGRLTLGIYTPLQYLLPEKRKKYADKYDMKVGDGHSVWKQDDREKNLVNLMRVNILKRLESSVHAFGLTVSRLNGRIEEVLSKIDAIEKGRITADDAYELAGEDEDESLDNDDPETEDMMMGGKIKVDYRDLDLVRWRQDLTDDRDRLTELAAAAMQVTPDRDAKLAELKHVITDKLQHPFNEGNRKILFFSAFADTADYLYEGVASWAKEAYGLNSALVTGTGRNRTTAPDVPKDYNSILTCFSPRSKERAVAYPDVKSEVDLLFATDCISEGQNLQDCDCLVNYDIHWNPVRIIQRFGRIDRIGSVSERVQLINFWPAMELEAYIKLEQRVRGRMMLLNSSATGEEDIINVTDSDIMNDLEYRKNQLARLQEEVVDIEELGGGLSITDLTLNDFRMDLMERLKTHREELETAPAGMYALVPSVINGKEAIQPGVIFTLRQAGLSSIESAEQNALHPYYLIYIQSDGTVKHGHVQAKPILDLYRRLCRGNDSVSRELVEAFDLETNEARDMKRYSELLRKAVDHIVGRKQEDGLGALFTLGKTAIAEESKLSGLDDFELVSFLIIR